MSLAAGGGGGPEKNFDGTLLFRTNTRNSSIPKQTNSGLAFQVPVIQLLLGQAGLVTSKAMLSQWRWVIVGATVAAAVLTPSTDPFTQTLLAVPLVGLYMGGALAVKAIEASRDREGAALG